MTLNWSWPLPLSNRGPAQVALAPRHACQKMRGHPDCSGKLFGSGSDDGVSLHYTELYSTLVLLGYTEELLPHLKNKTENTYILSNHHPNNGTWSTRILYLLKMFSFHKKGRVKCTAWEGIEVDIQDNTAWITLPVHSSERGWLVVWPVTEVWSDRMAVTQ